MIHRGTALIGWVRGSQQGGEGSQGKGPGLVTQHSTRAGPEGVSFTPRQVIVRANALLLARDVQKITCLSGGR